MSKTTNTPATDSFASPISAENITLAEMEAAFRDPAIITHGFQFDLRSCEIHDRTLSVAPIKLYPGPDDASDRPSDDELAKPLNWYGPVSAGFEGHATAKPVNMALTIAAIRDALDDYAGGDATNLRTLARTLFGETMQFHNWTASWESKREPGGSVKHHA